MNANETRPILLNAMDNTVDDMFVVGFYSEEDHLGVTRFLDNIAAYRLAAFLTPSGLEYAMNMIHDVTHQDAIYDFITTINAYIDMSSITQQNKLAILKSGGMFLVNDMLTKELVDIYKPDNRINGTAANTTYTINFIFALYVIRLYVNYGKHKMIQKAAKYTAIKKQKDEHE